MHPILAPIGPLPLPSPAELHAHIGYLLRELHVARRLLKLSQEVNERHKQMDDDLPAREANHDR